MSGASAMMLIGVGTSGCAIARGVSRAYGDGLRVLFADTDATSGEAGGAFMLLGGDRLSGRGAGGNLVSGRLAAEDSVKFFDEHLEGVRLAVIVTALGGGTGGGATIELAKYFSAKGVPCVVFATTPFVFEGEDRQRNARGAMTMIEDAASATFFLPLDKLIGESDNMSEAMRRAIDTVAGGVTLFWRLVGKPGYIRFDVERLRHLLLGAGRGRFAAVTAQGPSRAADAVASLMRSEMLSTSSGPVRATLCGVLAGEDLLLSEVGVIADGVRGAYGGLSFDLATVNDEETFSGRLCVVVMLFESNAKADGADSPGTVHSTGRKKQRSTLSIGPTGRGRFKNAEPTIYGGEDLDVPTFIRKNISLDV
ncbi:MAG: hypothetical protein J6R80_05080 [Kiritimatiellae bacterium]|nr:hypothetical protein [Kiritimatiellia bacterium]